jgi:putative transposase
MPGGSISERRKGQFLSGGIKKSSIRLMQDFRSLNRTFWGRHLRARGYFVVTSGNITDEIIAKYIANLDVEPQDVDLKVTE